MIKMIAYKDIFTGDELFNDSYPIKLIDDCYYEIEGKVITINESISDDLIGAGRSAEGDDDDVGYDAKTDIDIVTAFGLDQFDFTKEKFVRYIKEYMIKLIAHVKKNEPDRVVNLRVTLEAKVRDILNNFDDYKFYYGKTIDREACVLFLNYRKDGRTPYFTVFKDLLTIDKF